VRDISSRKHQETALLDTQRLLATLQSSIPGMICRCRNDGRWTLDFISEGCHALTGHGAAELLERKSVSFSALIHPEDKPVLWRRMCVAMRERKPFEAIFRLTTATGSEKRLHALGRPVLSGHGKVEAIEAFVTDITDRWQTGANLFQSISRERESLRYDLHDGLGQHLTALAFQCKALRQRLAAHAPQVAEEILPIQDAVRQAIQQVRQLARGISPVPIEPEGLLMALEQMAADTRQQFAMDCEFVSPEPVIHQPDCANQLFRIAQEAITNAVRPWPAASSWPRPARSRSSWVRTPRCWRQRGRCFPCSPPASFISGRQAPGPSSS
jgi:PAS domain S-box-containing protein